MSVEEFLTLVKMRGWVAFRDVVPSEFTVRLRNDLELAYERCRQLQIAKGMATETYGTAHHLLGNNDSLDEFLHRKLLLPHINAFLGGRCILNSYGAVLNRPGNTAYVNRIHRDVRTFIPGSPLMLNMLVMLDDFTTENGATLVLTGSNHVAERPGEDFFLRYADRFLGKAGDIVLFDSNVWHSAGINRTETVRRALTLTFTRPFMKQQMDYPRFLSPDYIAKLDDEMRQLLGFNARVPASYDEWYQPPETRFYKSEQG